MVSPACSSCGVAGLTSTASAHELARRHARDAVAALLALVVFGGALARPARLRAGHRPALSDGLHHRRRAGAAARSAWRRSSASAPSTSTARARGGRRSGPSACGAFKVAPLAGLRLRQLPDRLPRYLLTEPGLVRSRGSSCIRSWRTTPTSSPWWRSASWAAFSSSRRRPVRSSPSCSLPGASGDPATRSWSSTPEPASRPSSACSWRRSSSRKDSRRSSGS